MKKEPSASNTPSPELERYPGLCKQIYERMEKEGFPWEKAKGEKKVTDIL